MKTSSFSIIFIIQLLCTSKPAASFCSCSVDKDDDEKSCRCSGDEITGISNLFSADLCASGTPKKLVLENLPSLVQLSEGIEPPVQIGCVGWSGLTSLSLHQTGIQNVSSTMFRGLYNLIFLDISNNSKITNYRDEVFRSIGGTLTELIATDNKVHSLTKRVFSGLKTIKRLVLSRNKIGYIEASVFSNDCCSHLTELRLDFNFITELEEDTFRGLVSLQILDLRGNPLQRLFSGLFSPFASSLTHLMMSHNDSVPFGGFTSIPGDVFAHMSQLRVLEISELKLRNLTPVSFMGLTNLEELVLRGNRLTVIPKNCFSSLPNLRKLDLSANALVCLPDNSKYRFPHLRWLDLSWNGLTHLTRQPFTGLASSPPIPDYPSLILNISHNPIQRIEPDAFCGLGGSTELIISSKQDQAVDQNALKWNTMDNWPESPFALVGNMSYIQGLQGSESRVPGRDDASIICAPGGELMRSAILSSPLYELAKYSQEDVDSSRTSECPWLAPPKISQWQLSKLGVPGLSGTPQTSNNGNALEQGSRIYLLIIVAVCVTFLLSALTIIMCYRAWSRRASKKLTDGDFEAHGTGDSDFPAVLPEDLSQKHELLEHVKTVPSNGRITSPGTALGPLPETSEPALANGHSSQTNSTVHQIRDGSSSPEESRKPLVARQHSASSDEDGRRHSRSDRRISEPKGEGLEQMTAFGVL